MKISVRLLISILLFFVIFLSLPNPSTLKVSAESESDQYCDDDEINTADKFWDFNGHTLAQSFTPDQINLDSVMVAVAMGADNPDLVTVELRKITDGDALIAARSVTGSTQLVSWVELDFTGTTVDTNKQYQIIVSTTSTTAHWVYSTADCYDGGTVIADGSAQTDQDFGFVTTGSGGATPVSAEEPTTETPATGTSTTTITIIEKPTAVKAEYLTADKNIKISWAKSTTTDIDGYKIYRSEFRTKAYEKISEVNKNVIEYRDNALTAEKTYYYFVRAYKGSDESENSGLASATTPIAEATVAISETPKKAITPIDPGDNSSTNYQLPIIVWILGGLAGVSAIALIIYEIIRARKKATNPISSFRLLK